MNFSKYIKNDRKTNALNIANIRFYKQEKSKRTDTLKINNAQLLIILF